MPLYADFALARYEDGVLTIVMTPPVSIGGQTIEFVMGKRFGSQTPFVTKVVASGFNGASGITITDSGVGRMNVNLFATPDMSGREENNYAWSVKRIDSGYHTTYVQGYLVLGPGIKGG